MHILQINYLYISLFTPNFEFSIFSGFFDFFIIFEMSGIQVDLRNARTKLQN